jgi:Yip1 domain
MDLIERVKAIILSPKTEWPVIAGEPDDAQGLFKNYVAILAAIPAVCGFIGTALIGMSISGVGTMRVGVGGALVSAIVGYVLAFVGVYVLALIVDALAPSFGGSKGMGNALKLVAYSATPSWLCGIFALIPALSFLGILGLYSLYLFYVGLPVLMKSPQEKTLIYAIAVLAVGIVISLIIGFIQVRLIGF